jgi:hypothetical protein
MTMNRETAVSLLDRPHAAQNELYAGGPDASLKRLLDPDIIWNVPGDNAIAGTYQGVEAVLGFAQIGAIVTMFVWCLAVEQILAGVSTSAARLLPLLGAMTMAGADSRGIRAGGCRGRCRRE